MKLHASLRPFDLDAWIEEHRPLLRPPVSNRLLLEAGFGSYRSRWGGKEIPGLGTTDLIRVVEQCAAG